MGKVLKQSFWSTIVIYFGVLLGFINSIILFPKFLTTEEIGLIRQIISASTILIPIATFGASSTYVKYYPLFKESIEEKKQFFSLNLLIILISYSIVLFFLFFLLDEIKLLFSEKSQLFFDYFYIVYFILFIMSISILIEAYLRARYDTILSNIINGVSNRFLTAVTVILLSLSVIDFDYLIKSQVIIYSIGLIVLIYYTNKKDKLSVTIRFEKIKKHFSKIFNYRSYAFLGSFSNIIVLNVDVLMVTSLLGLSQTGIYTTAFYIGMVIEIPRRAISQISIPFISENIKNNKIKEIEKNYKEVSLHQMLIGILFFILVVTNLDNIFSLIPNSNEFIKGKDVVYIIGLSKLIIMFFSYNSELISLSKYYRFTVITIIILAFVSIILNLILIPKYGMIGAAYASLTSIAFYNIIKFIFIKLKMKISPFSINSFKVVLIGLLVFIISNYLIPSSDNPWIDILIKSLSSTSIYLILIYKIKVSEKFNDLLNQFIKIR
ncbi:MAG: oligosaccharide flippase family protein [Cytophagales bacterium]|nr:oligosaccharide flippase family protein [Cytophagales bacterium]